MSHKTRTSQPTKLDLADLEKRPEVWLLQLIDARERGDHSRIAHALVQLEQLGVKVRFGRPKKPRLLPGGVQ